VSIWHDAFHLKHAIGCVREVQPVRWREVLAKLRRSRRYRKSFLAHARGMWQFRASLAINRIKP
jgi:hypothetical protein